MKTIKKVLSIVMLALLSMGVTQAQDAEALADKCSDAMGGVDKWKAIKSIKQTMNLNMQGLDIPATMIRDSKDRLHMELTAMGSKMVQAHNGTTAWWINPFQGVPEAALMPEAAAKEALTQKMLDPMIDWRTNGSTVSFEGEEEYREKDCYKLKLSVKGGFDFIYFISKENHLIVVRRVKSNLQGFEQIIDSYYSDYSEQNGVMLHGKEEMIAGGVVA